MNKVTEDVKVTSYDSLRDFKNKLIKESEMILDQLIVCKDYKCEIK